MHLVLKMLSSDHHRMSELMALIDQQLTDLGKSHDVDLVKMRAITGHMVEMPDCSHHPLEDIIFQQLQVRAPEAKELVDQLHQEHIILRKHGTAFVQKLEFVLSDGVLPRDEIQKTGNDYLTLLRAHMNEEEATVFPWADRCLAVEDWTSIEESPDFTRHRTPGKGFLDQN